MKFAPLELCKNLVELGCKSESQFTWDINQDPEDPAWPILEPERAKKLLKEKVLVPAFEQNDFTGSNEQAIENAKLVWGDKKVPVRAEISLFKKGNLCILPGENERSAYLLAFVYGRHEMIDSDDWVKFLEESLREHQRAD